MGTPKRKKRANMMKKRANMMKKIMRKVNSGKHVAATNATRMLNGTHAGKVVKSASKKRKNRIPKRKKRANIMRKRVNMMKKIMRKVNSGKHVAAMNATRMLNGTHAGKNVKNASKKRKNRIPKRKKRANMMKKRVNMMKKIMRKVNSGKHVAAMNATRMLNGTHAG